MMVGPRSHTLLFPLLLLVSLMGVSGGWWWDDFKYRHVYIKNGLDNGALLTFHCKSENKDDFGIKTLKSGEEFKFQFRPSFFTVTIFRCRFSWLEESHLFDIYDYSRDDLNCHDCYWSIMSDCPCRFDDDSHFYDICTFGYF
ncbi:putative plant self-incompatibility S1 [Lupinus albus]|uniref:S-protein homolog n=1 Tax=Lupinus albus TaxID=3870 RepID=A0A6A4NWQ9_LUPAL|nr:putative plant self-incompatibility S1 [Lupinus albus]